MNKKVKIKLIMFLSGFAGGCFGPLYYIGSTILIHNYYFELNAILAVLIFGGLGGVLGLYAERIPIFKVVEILLAIGLIRIIREMTDAKTIDIVREEGKDVKEAAIVRDVIGAAFIIGLMPYICMYTFTNTSLDRPPSRYEGERSSQQDEVGIAIPNGLSLVPTAFASDTGKESEIISVPVSKYKQFGMIPTVLLFPDSANHGVPYYFRSTFDVYSEYYKGGNYTFSVKLVDGERIEKMITDLTNGSFFKFYAPTHISEYSIKFNGKLVESVVPEKHRGSAIIDFFFKSKRVINFQSVISGRSVYVIEDIKTGYSVLDYN
jgi:hypothetical protein